MAILTSPLLARNAKYELKRLDRPTDISNLNDNFFDLFRYIEGYFVDRNSNQNIKGDKTFTGTTTLGVVNVSSVTATNTITADEVVTTYGFYHDRGTVSAFDYTLTNLTENDTFQPLDLSAIVPAGAKTVCFTFGFNGTANTVSQFRKNGYTGTGDVYNIRTQVNGLLVDGTFIVPCDENRVIEYSIPASAASAYLVIKGWWK